MSWSSLFTMCNMKHVPVCTSPYQYVPVHTEYWHDINSIYWYVLVHTGECTNLYVPVRTRTYAYSQFSVLSKKRQKGLEPAIFCILLAELTPTLWEYRPQRRIFDVLSSRYILPTMATCLCKRVNFLMSNVQDVTLSSWEHNIQQFHDQRRWVAWIHPAGETYLGALCARIVICSGQYFVWLMWDVSCASRVHCNCAWFLNFSRPG